MPTYYFTAASEQFLLQEEPVEEILRERLRFYNENNLTIDFWLTKKSNILQIPEINAIKNNINGDLVAIISTNPTFINWLKLRLQYVITGTFSMNNTTDILQYI